MEDISNKTLALLLVVAMAVSLVGIFTAQKGEMIRISGRATDTGTAYFEQLSVASINVTEDINFGAGRVDAGFASATLDSRDGTVTNGNWSFSAQQFLIENDGTVNLSVQIRANDSAATFIGGAATTPSIKYQVDQEEATSCIGGITGGASYAEMPIVDTGICANLKADPTANLLDTTIELTVPVDAIPGSRALLVTYTGTGI